jgi:hypothetical protein
MRERPENADLPTQNRIERSRYGGGMVKEGGRVMA